MGVMYTIEGFGGVGKTGLGGEFTYLVAGIGVIIFPNALGQHPQLHLGCVKIPEGLP